MSDAKRSDPMLRPMILLVAVVVLLALGYLGYMRSLRKSVEERLEWFRSQGLPVTLAELDAWYVTPPAGKNAADFYLEAFGKLVEPSYEQERLLPFYGTNLPSGNAPLPEDMRKAMEDLVTANQEAIEALHSVPQNLKCRYPVRFLDGPYLDLSHLPGFINASQILATDAVICAEQGNRTGAVRELMSMFALQRSLDDEPTVASRLFRVYSWDYSCLAFERMLNQLSLTEEDLANLSSDISEKGDRERIRRGLAGDLPLIHADFKQGRHPGIDLPHLVPFLKVTGIWAIGHAQWMDLQRELFEAVGEDDQSLVNWQRKLEDRHSNISLRYHPSAIALRRNYPQMVTNLLEYFARIRVLSAAIAVERHRLAHGKLPGSLDELVPRFLEAVPTDPFTGKPMDYELINGGFRIIWTDSRGELDTFTVERGADSQ